MRISKVFINSGWQYFFQNLQIGIVSKEMDIQFFIFFGFLFNSFGDIKKRSRPFDPVI